MSSRFIRTQVKAGDKLLHKEVINGARIRPSLFGVSENFPMPSTVFAGIKCASLEHRLRSLKAICGGCEPLADNVMHIRPRMYRERLENLYNTTALWIEFRRDLNLVQWCKQHTDALTPEEISLMDGAAKVFSTGGYGYYSFKSKNWLPVEHDDMRNMAIRLQSFVEHFSWSGHDKVIDIFKTADNQLEWAYNLWLPSTHEMNKEFQRRIDERGYLTREQMVDNLKGGYDASREERWARPLQDSDLSKVVTSLKNYFTVRLLSAKVSGMEAHFNKVERGENVSPYLKSFKRVQKEMGYASHAEEKLQEALDKKHMAMVGSLTVPLQDWGLRSYQMVYPLYQYLLSDTSV